jgi:Ca-activated chloride channel family protein
MLNRVRSAAERGIYTSLLGIGLDFNPDVVEAMSKAKGAWYGSVKNAQEFRRRLDEEFDYMVTPLVFNLRLHAASESWAIDRVFGSPEAELATGQLMRVNTLFPSPKDSDGQTKGGIVLLRLVRKRSACSDLADGAITLRVTYEDRCGVPDFCEQRVVPPPKMPHESSASLHGYFENSGVRKAVLLARYASVLHQWLVDERQALAVARFGFETAETLASQAPCSCGVLESGGIFSTLAKAAVGGQMLGEWEQRSVALKVSPQYRAVFAKLQEHVAQEALAMDDESLEREVALLQKLRTCEHDD